jgi:uncharacterized protein with HEPN domain
MTTSEKRKLLLTQFNENLVLLHKSVIALDYSYDKCRAIGEKGEFDLDQQESFEALASRFARTSDILTQKVFKTLFILLQENIKTIIDAANLLEKLAVLESADDLLNVRELRNQIAHEYVESDVKALFFDVLRYVPEIKKIINNVTAYYHKHLSSTKPDDEIK